MKIIFQIFILLGFFQIIKGQTLFESALDGTSNIVVKKPTKIYLENYHFNAKEFLNWLDLRKVEFNHKDTTELKLLIEKVQVSDPVYRSWTEMELPNKILIGENDFVSIKKGLEIIPWKTKEDKKG